jgi:hypothetical protein
MTTIAALRTTYLNKYLARSDADTQPWATTDLDQHLADAVTSLWPVHGLFAVGDVATDSSTQEYTVPASIARLSRIEMLDSSGHYLSPVTNWRTTASGKVVVKPLLATGYTLRFSGWKAYAAAGTDLPANLEDVVAKLAASQAYGQLAASLTNSQRQQTLDSGRIVDHQQAISLGAYWQRLAESRLFNDPSRVSLAPRRAQR